MEKEKYIWGLLRLGMGWIFFWAFIDKVFGFGFATAAGKSWLAGGSPTTGFLNFAVKGPFSSFYHGLAGNPLVDVLFMAGLLFVGITLLSGIMVRLGSYTGIVMLLSFYTAGFIPPANNPFLDEHMIYSLILAGFTIVGAGQWLGLGSWWGNRSWVKKYSILK